MEVMLRMNVIGVQSLLEKYGHASSIGFVCGNSASYVHVGGSSFIGKMEGSFVSIGIAGACRYITGSTL